MPRKKKSRKVGQIGVPSVPKEARKPRAPSVKTKKRKGNAAGSRHSAGQDSTAQASKQQQDSRVGSKKPVQLIVEPKPKASAKPRYFTPAQELEAIENDQRLSQLLDKLDRNAKLSVADQLFVDERMARHKALCDLLGVQPESEQKQKSTDEVDLFDKFDAIDIDDFKDE